MPRLLWNISGDPDFVLVAKPSQQPSVMTYKMISKHCFFGNFAGTMVAQFGIVDVTGRVTAPNLANSLGALCLGTCQAFIARPS